MKYILGHSGGGSMKNVIYHKNKNMKNKQQNT